MKCIYQLLFFCALCLTGLRGHAAEDFTSYIINPNFDNASSDGWQGDAPGMCGDGSHCAANVAEHWNRGFNTYQDLSGLPDGTYQLHAKTAFRGSWEDYKSGRDAAAKLYAIVGDKNYETPFNSMWSCLNTESLSGNTYFGTVSSELNHEEGGITYYIPNDPSAFRLYAERGYYDTTLFFEVIGGKARIGIKNETMCDDGCDNWSCFDSFTLTYYGSSQDSDWIEMLINGNAEGTNVTNFVGRDGDNKEDRPARIVNGAGVGGSRAYQVHSIANAENDWDSQFFIYTPKHVWKAGDRYRFSFMVRADKPAHISAESQITPGEYIYYSFAEDGYDVTTNWQRFDYEGTVTQEQAGENGMQTIAITLNELRGVDNDYYFDNISWKAYKAQMEQGVDITDILKNPDFEEGIGEGSAEGWHIEKNADGNFTSGPLGDDLEAAMTAALGVPNHCFESWHCHDFELWQEVENLPAGIYELQVQGFVRCETPGYERGDLESDLPKNAPIYLYLNDSFTRFPDVYSEKRPVNPSTGQEYQYGIIEDWTVEEVNGYQYPNSTGGAAQCFAWGMYKTSVFAEVTHQGDNLRIGVKGKMDNDWWCAWDNFRLIYHGNGEPTIDEHDYKEFSEDSVLITTVDNISQEKKTLNWIEGGSYQATRDGTINPQNGHEGTGVITEGIMLNKDNTSKTLLTYVTGVESIWAYGCSNSTSSDLVLTVYDQLGNVVTSKRGTSSNGQSVKVEIKNLNPEKKYKVDYTGCEKGTENGSDFVLHGIKFVKNYYNEKTFVVSGLKYHTLSDETVEVVGYENPSSSLTIPTKVTNQGVYYNVISISSHAFLGCSTVTSVRLPAGMKKICEQAFSFSDIQRVTISSTVTEIGPQAFWGHNMKIISVNSASPYFKSVSDVLFNKDQTKLICYPAAKSDSYYDIPETVQILDVSAFRDCNNLEYVTIPESVTESWWNAFEDCTNLKTIVCLSKEPREWGDDTFSSGVYSKATLYVPSGYTTKYRSMSPWKNFNSISTIPSKIIVKANSYTNTYGDDLPTKYEYTVTQGPLYGIPTTECDANAQSNAGEYPITVNNGTLHSVSELELINGTLTINKAPLTISVGNYTKKQGDPMPQFVIDYSGFVKEEDENVLTKKPTISCSANATSSPGSYTIRVSGASSPNYSFTYKNGTLTVEAADAILVKAYSYNIKYGDALPTFGYTVEGGQLNGTPAISCSAGSHPDAGVYDIVITKGSVSNYNVTYVNGVLTVDKVPLTISMDNYTKKQGDLMPEFKINYSGFVNGENENTLTKKPTISCSANASSAPGTYPIKVYGAASPNYSFTYNAGTLTVVPADAIVVKANSYTITYGDALPNFKYTVEGGQLNGTPTISCNAGSRPDTGTYDIVISKGSVSNYNVTYVNGTLTVVKAPLTVSVGNYTKYEDEENPAFDLTYDGFKYGQNIHALTKVPTAYCEARLWSPAGNYPIVVSGGESKNYAFNYVNGTLTVKKVYGLTITTIGKGYVDYEGNQVKSFSHFNVREGGTAVLSFVPDDGYRLEKVTSNGSDITYYVTNNNYTIKNIKNDVNIVATFGESQGIFSIDGIRYRILSAPAKTVIVDNSSMYKGNMVIPSKVYYQDQEWSVVGITDNAFYNRTSLVSIELPGSLVNNNVGLSLFTGCTSLAAIIWNADFKLSSSQLGTIENPNLLFYANSQANVPTGIKNAVIGERASNIVLQDGDVANFYCPKAFTASAISYTHNYTMTSAIGDIQGWETLALPFSVEKIEHETHGNIIPFAKYDASQASQRPFWLFTYSAWGFIRASKIEAYKPYLICMPNNEEYDQDYCLAGNVTFSAQNARIEPTDKAQGITRDSKTFTPVFLEEKKASGIYALNVSNMLYSETGGYNPGSVFVNGLRNISPFEACMMSNSSGARMVIDIDFDEAAEIEELINDGWCMLEGKILVYNLSGQLMIQATGKEELKKSLKCLPKGIYLINGKKIQIK